MSGNEESYKAIGGGSVCGWNQADAPGPPRAEDPPPSQVPCRSWNTRPPTTHTAQRPVGCRRPGPAPAPAASGTHRVEFWVLPCSALASGPGSAGTSAARVETGRAPPGRGQAAGGVGLPRSALQPSLPGAACAQPQCGPGRRGRRGRARGRTAAAGLREGRRRRVTACGVERLWGLRGGEARGSGVALPPGAGCFRLCLAGRRAGEDRDRPGGASGADHDTAGRRGSAVEPGSDPLSRALRPLRICPTEAVQSQPSSSPVRAGANQRGLHRASGALAHPLCALCVLCPALQARLSDPVHLSAALHGRASSVPRPTRLSTYLHASLSFSSPTHAPSATMHTSASSL
nr:uncharacterized protein LOC106028688 [Cavia porcellus]